VALSRRQNRDRIRCGVSAASGRLRWLPPGLGSGLAVTSPLQRARLSPRLGPSVRPARLRPASREPTRLSTRLGSRSWPPVKCIRRLICNVQVGKKAPAPTRGPISDLLLAGRPRGPRPGPTRPRPAPGLAGHAAPAVPDLLDNGMVPVPPSLMVPPCSSRSSDVPAAHTIS